MVLELRTTHAARYEEWAQSHVCAYVCRNDEQADVGRDRNQLRLCRFHLEREDMVMAIENMQLLWDWCHHHTHQLCLSYRNHATCRCEGERNDQFSWAEGHRNVDGALGGGISHITKVRDLRKRVHQSGRKGEGGLQKAYEMPPLNSCQSSRRGRSSHL